MKRKTLLAATSLLMAGVMAGCGGGSKAAGATDGASSASTASNGDNTLSIWGQASVWLPSDVNEVEKVPFLQELQAATGVKLNLTAASGDTKEQFNLMIAGGKDNLPDIIDNVNFFEGGATSAYEKGYIIELNDLIDQYAPNVKEMFETYPEIEYACKDMEGKTYTLPRIDGTYEACKNYASMFINKTWLDNLGLEIPTTWDELGFDCF